MIDLDAATRLIDLGTSQGSELRGKEQLQGAVALHNMLRRQRVAYLADEVGMGKTYVALAVMALMRHYNPSARVLVIAPKENIQHNWEDAFKNFVELNMRFPDLRVKGLHGPTRPPVLCDRLVDFVREARVAPDRDFILRLTSFRLPLRGGERIDEQAANEMRDALKDVLPWLEEEVFDLRRIAFKDNVARAICCALPRFDLVIIDEAHNLKHGFAATGSSQNRVLALTLGHPEPTDDGAELRRRAKLFRGYGQRGEHVLLMSATPIDEDYRHLWNQLDMVGRGDGWRELADRTVSDGRKKEIVRRLLIRRVTSMEIAGSRHTKNLYRREWRGGGVAQHDHPIEITDDRARLVVALVQKKVSELLDDRRLGNRFQIGMLASFESFLQTAKVRREEETVFDDGEQTDDTVERDGLDVRDVNDLARRYRELFSREMPHPKMDALVEEVETSWRTGNKALVFVRRVASVKELRRKLEDRYDAWVTERLRAAMPATATSDFERIVERYAREKQHARDVNEDVDDVDEAADGSAGTFFGYYFRKRTSLGVWSGSTLQRALAPGQGTYFDDHDLTWLLQCRTDEIEERLAEAVDLPVRKMLAELRRRSGAFLSRAQKHTRGKRLHALTAATAVWLSEIEGPQRERAEIMVQERYADARQRPAASDPPEVGDWLKTPTFFSRLSERRELARRLLPTTSSGDTRAVYRERVVRSTLLAAACRLGHAAIDLYVTQLRRRGTIALGEGEDRESSQTELSRIDDFLDLLEEQQRSTGSRDWAAFDELAAIADNFDLILSVNEPDARKQPLAEVTSSFGTLLGVQVPIGGMSGRVNRRLVRQFRMPGYPVCLISTDLLQEGENLHTFCSSIYHYGISWTPSSMEQRIGRIDRVLSQTARRLDGRATHALPEEKLQVYYPYLRDTVEVLQVRRVFERMNRFLRLMHEELGDSGDQSSHIEMDQDAVAELAMPQPIQDELKSAFDVNPELLHGDIKQPEVDETHHRGLVARFDAVAARLTSVVWSGQQRMGVRLGTITLETRSQPIGLYLRSFGARGMVRCISPIGIVTPDDADAEHVLFTAPRHERVRIGVRPDDDGTYNLTVEGDVLLTGDEATDVERVRLLVDNVARRADTLELEILRADAPLSQFEHELADEDPHGA